MVKLDVEVYDPNDEVRGLTVEEQKPGSVSSVTHVYLGKGDVSADSSWTFPVACNANSPVGTYTYTVTASLAHGASLVDTLTLDLQDTHPLSTTVNTLPQSLAGRGDSLTLTGTGLDQVARVFVGEVPVEVTAQSATSIAFEVGETLGDHTVKLVNTDGDMVITTNELRIEGEVVVWENYDPFVRPGELKLLPVDVYGLDFEDLVVRVNGIQNGNATVGAIDGVFYRAPDFSPQTQQLGEPIDIEIEFPGDPLTPTITTVVTVELILQEDCVDIGTLVLDTSTVRLDASDENGRFRVTGPVAASVDGTAISLDVENYPSVPEFASNDGQNLHRLSVTGSHPLSASSLEFSYEGPFNDMPNMEAWFREVGGTTWHPVNGEAQTGDQYSGILPGFGEILIRLPEQELEPPGVGYGGVVDYQTEFIREDATRSKHVMRDETGALIGRQTFSSVQSQTVKVNVPHAGFEQWFMRWHLASLGQFDSRAAARRNVLVLN